MMKISTVFTRGDDGLVRDEVDPRAEVVLSGRCIATKKFDGSCCLFHGGMLWKRRMLKVERPEGEGILSQIAILPFGGGDGGLTELVRPLNLPENFIAAQDVVWQDDDTGRIPGWVPVGDDPEDQWHREALNASDVLREGVTYELLGPAVQGNKQCLSSHILTRHGMFSLMNAPIDFAGLREYLEDFPMEGIVWWLDDEPVAKIKRRDFGLEW